MSKRRTAWIAAGVIMASAAAWPAAAAPPFRAAVQTHLDAIVARDMDRLLPTLTQGGDLTMIMPGGVTLETRQQYVDFHREWFATQDEGRLEPVIVRVVESPTLGHALVRYRYSAKDPTGKPHTIVSWLALTFALEDGRWGLVFDQNTPISEPTS